VRSAPQSRRTLPQLERLLLRAQKLTWKIRPEDFAEWLVGRGFDSDSADAGGVGGYFEDVWQYMKELKPEQKRICAECGDDSADRLYDRSDTRYCSAKCRQKAYRKRVTGKASPRTRKRNGTVNRYTSSAEIESQSVMHEGAA
jgi:hypothetical protein